MNRTAFVCDIGVRVLGALGRLSLHGLIALGAYLILRDLASIPLSWIAQSHLEPGDIARLGLQGAAILATLAVSVLLLRYCMRWHRRYTEIGEAVEFDPETRIATTQECDKGYIDAAYVLIEFGLALLVAALVAYTMWGELAAVILGVAGLGLTAVGIALLVVTVMSGDTSHAYYPGTPEFSTLAAQYALGTEERHRIAEELAQIPASSIDYPMAQKMLESCLSGTPLSFVRFGFGLPPGTPLPPGPNEAPERIG